MKAKSKGGNKFKKMKKGFGEVLTKLEIADKDQNYAQVISMLGDCRISLKCIINNKVVNKLGIIRGSMRKKQWINSGDIVIVSIRDFEPDKCDVIYVYPKDRKNEIINKKLLDFGDKQSSIQNNEDIIFFDNSDNEKDEPTHFQKETELASNHQQFIQKPWFMTKNNESESEEDDEQQVKTSKIQFNLDDDLDNKNDKIDDDWIDDI
jgi:translation initiation factor 1A